MKIHLLVAAVNIGFIFLLSGGIAAEAAEVRVLSAAGIMAAMQDLGPKFERASGHKLTIAFEGVNAIVKRVQGGDTADVVVMPRQGIDRLVKDGKVASGNVTDVARAGLVAAIRRGTPRPDISSPESFRRALLAAKSITLPNPEGVGNGLGIHLAKVLDRLEIRSEVTSKTVYPKGVNLADLIANGQAEIGVQMYQNLVDVAGLEIVGPLPAELQAYVVFAATVMPGAKNAEASKALVDFLRTPAAATVIKATGMEPATP